MADTDTPTSTQDRVLALIEAQANPETPLVSEKPPRTMPPVSQSDAEAEQRDAAKPRAEGAEYDPPVERKAEVSEPPAPRLLKVKVDGQEQELPEDEVVKGFQFNAHNTQTSMKLQAERKAAEEARTEYLQTREAMKAKLQAMDEALVLIKAPEKDWAKLRQENPTEFAVQWAEHQQTEQARERIARERLQIQQQQEFEATQARQAYVQEQQVRLLDALPEWKDPVKKQQDDQRLMQVGQQYGYSAQELAGVTDYRAVLVLRDAMLYRELQAKKTDLPKPGTSPVLKPGAATPPTSTDTDKQYQSARAKLRETGNPKDAVAAVLAALNRS